MPMNVLCDDILAVVVLLYHDWELFCFMCNSYGENMRDVVG